MENIMEYIRPELVILIPVLYFVGVGLKKSESVPDKHIPIILGVAGILLAALYVVATSALDSWQAGIMAAFVAATQGILTAGCSVYVNQLIKQKEKGEKEE